MTKNFSTALLLTVFILSRFVTSQKKFPNIQFLERGYDIVKGNPYATVYDPGFTGNQIYDFAYSGKTTSDGRYYVPDGVSGVREISCSNQTQSYEIQGTTSLHDSFKLHVGAGFSGYGFKFSASADYKKVRDETETEHKVFYTSFARCSIYFLANQDGGNINKEFSLRIKNLKNRQDYYNLIQDYGTHAIKNLRMGARNGVKTEFTRNSYEKALSEGLELKVAASYSYLGAKGYFDSLTDIQKKMAKQFDEQKRNSEEYHLGVLPTYGGFDKWAEAAGNDPYPMFYDFIIISDLLVPRNFPDIPSHELRDKRTLLAESLLSYCGHVEGCSPLGSEWIETHIYTKTVGGFGRKEVVCGVGETAISCGSIFSNGDNSVWSHEYNKCICNHYGSGSCTATCVKNIEETKYFGEEKQFNSGTVDVQCRPGFFVASCGLNANRGGFTNFYPLDQNTCRCESANGGTCFAKCTQAVHLHSILSSEFSNSEIVTCPSQTEAIACHINTRFPTNIQSFRQLNKKSCACTTQTRSNCIAICGRVMTTGDDYFEYRRTDIPKLNFIENNGTLKGNRFRIQERCDDLPNCFAYTLDGYLFSRLEPVSKWSHNNPRNRVFVKDYDKYMKKVAKKNEKTVEKKVKDDSFENNDLVKLAKEINEKNGDIKIEICLAAAWRSIECTATCPLGYSAIGGGCQNSVVDNRITSSYPTPQATGWVCSVRTDAGRNWNYWSLRGFVVCKRDIYVQVLKGPDVPGFRQASSLARCNFGFNLLSGGCFTPNSHPSHDWSWHLQESFPTNELGISQWKCTHGHDHSGGGDNYFSGSWALCTSEQDIRTVSNKCKGGDIEGTCDAHCPSGYTPVSGGCSSSWVQDHWKWRITNSEITSSGWRCSLFVDWGVGHVRSQEFTTYVNCLRKTTKDTIVDKITDLIK